MQRNRRTPCVVVIVAALLGATTLHGAKVEVSGAGFWRDRDLHLSLDRLLAAREKPSLDANAMEDAAVILMAALGEEGFQQPKIEIEAKLADGSDKRFAFDPTFANPLPRPFESPVVRFRLTPGVRSRVEKVEFHGLTAIGTKEATNYFRSNTTLIVTAKANAYSPSRINRAADALLAELRQRGFVDSEVRAEKSAEEKGAVTVSVEVHEGARWMVKAVRFQDGEPGGVTLPSAKEWIGRAWSPTMLVEIRETIRRAYYREGFPDVGVHVEAEGTEVAPGQMEADVVATMVPGARVHVGQVVFKGNEVTRESVLRRRVELKTDDPLNPLAMERARYRISRLGVFDSVNLSYEPPDGAVRDVVLDLKEGGRYETNLLFGYGSYEQFRAGFEFRQMNIFGLAHQSTAQLVQSMKSTSGEYAYTVPELFGESLDGTVKLFGLQRKEIAFLRQEFGVSATLKRPVPRTGGDATLSYTFQALRNRQNTLSTQATDEGQVNVASLTAALSGDRRDNRLRPRQGYHWSAQVEAAEPWLGGATAYQRFEVGGAYHTGWGGGRWIHVGLTHGVITTFGDDDHDLPVNKRFYPGGDNSIRGYQRGEAAPRGADGLFIGAKSYLLLNVEFEQALTQNWSVVAFGDSLGMAQVLRDYPFKERLYSVGLGVRYQTLIGPLRLEYGRNVNPRVGDPPGTWQFSLGYPF